MYINKPSVTKIEAADRDHFIKPRSVLKQLCMWLVEVVNANKQLSVSKKFCFKYRTR